MRFMCALVRSCCWPSFAFLSFDIPHICILFFDALRMLSRFDYITHRSFSCFNTDEAMDYTFETSVHDAEVNTKEQYVCTEHVPVAQKGAVVSAALGSSP
jgi:hypothetical protein